MSPPEVWGPAIWNLFHTLIEKVNENAYPYISKQLFNIIVRICKFLPCPECSNDASLFLAKLKIENLKTKRDFKNTFYLFHNYVNAKKKKPLFNYANINVYKRYKLIQIINNFILAYNTKGNMKLLAETFQRQFVVKDFKAWFIANIWAFFTPSPTTNNIAIKEDAEITLNLNSELIQQNNSNNSSNELSENVIVCFDENDIKCIEDKVVAEEPVIEEEAVTEEPVIEEEQVVTEEQVIEEEQVVEDKEEEPLVEDKEEEPLVEDKEEDKVVTEEEQVVEEDKRETHIKQFLDEHVEKKKNKKKKKTKNH